MPLLDIDWTKNDRDPFAFLVNWSACVADALNAQLPNAERFRAEPLDRTRLKTGEEIAGFAQGPPVVSAGGQDTDQKYPGFDAPAPTFVAPARFTDRVGVNVSDAHHGRRVTAVVMFVTPDNKADSDSSLAFAVRAAALMSRGAGVVIVDALPGPASWATHLHSLVGVYPITKRPRGTDAPVLVVHPQVHNGAEQFAVWHYTVASAFPLPTVPVPIRGAMNLKLDLEATYAAACERGTVS
ncbi:hypothetical protein VT84_30225 [Gemmata sp. SH-PL17]|uniref:hypothetical protein n=1 Tax=Gemmata sp. SH-PL17 TaxID=1630693 RepID=UPI00078ED253|nr:hypothetical protein [Gemmata sp. SH-PL17]AMV28721.1 hypothetical protein VT84_30225 [Gemmata sp. SH-PL17]